MQSFNKECFNRLEESLLEEISELKPERVSDVLGVTPEAVIAYEEIRKEAFTITGKKYPIRIEDLKWGVD